MNDSPSAVSAPPPASPRLKYLLSLAGLLIVTAVVVYGRSPGTLAGLWRPTLPPMVEPPPLLAGDAAKGEALFFSTELACAQCHARQGRGGAVGPDLTHVASRMPLRTIEKFIVAPTGREMHGFADAIVLAADGSVHAGVMNRVQLDPVEVFLPDGRAVRIKRGEVESIKEQQLSRMPMNYADRLTVRQLADLLAYLAATPAPLQSNPLR